MENASLLRHFGQGNGIGDGEPHIYRVRFDRLGFVARFFAFRRIHTCASIMSSMGSRFLAMSPRWPSAGFGVQFHMYPDRRDMQFAGG